MKPSTRIALAVVASFAAVAYIALIWLTAALGGPWELVTVAIFVLCAASAAAIRVLARLAPDDPVYQPPQPPDKTAELMHAIRTATREGRIDYRDRRRS
jgi:membrane protein implicated in regulation of membrane protease activity